MVWLLMMHLGLSQLEGEVPSHLYMVLHTMKWVAMKRLQTKHLVAEQDAQRMMKR
jgi:hypothetical protein